MVTSVICSTAVVVVRVMVWISVLVDGMTVAFEQMQNPTLPVAVCLQFGGGPYWAARLGVGVRFWGLGGEM